MPSDGEIQGDSLTLSSITHIYVSQNDSGGNSVSSFLNEVKANDLIRVFDKTNPGKFLIGKVTAATVSSGIYDFTITNLASAGSFTADVDLGFTLSPAGPQGPQA